MHWTEEFFDEYYLKSIHSITTEQRTQKEVDFLLSNVEINHENKILDLACGDGRHAIELARRGYNQVVGLDLTPMYIQLANEKSEDLTNQPRFIQDNMTNLNTADEYDLIYSYFSSLFYFKDKKNIRNLKRIFQALKRDGYFLFDQINPISFLRSTPHKDWYTTEDNYLILDKYNHNAISGIITNERLIVTPEGKRINRVFYFRDYTVAELRFHLEKIGFEIIDVFGTFDSDPYSIESPRQIFITRKPV
ncbi:MAG: methyltransferase domain-containing protein [Caldithrix sp.]|nr:methyltransferase domain-containing protein [Caldithrix sp.]